MEDNTRRPSDYVVVILIGLGCVPMIIGNAVILINRNYRPMKTRSVILTVLSSVGGLIWVLATLVVNNHFGRREKSVCGLCVVWTFWLQACFGFALWLNCLIVRLFTLHLIFIRKRRHVKHTFVTLFLLLLPVIIFCTVASARRASRFHSLPSSSSQRNPKGNPKGDCKIHRNGWAYGMLTLLLLYFIIFLGFAFSLRNTMSQFNEFRLIRNGGIMSLFLFLLSLVTIATKTYDEVAGRFFLSLAVAVAVFYYFWARNGEVVFNVLFNREEYERKFHEELNRLPSERERVRFPDSFQNLETRLREARQEIARDQNRVRALEEEISKLEESCS